MTISVRRWHDRATWNDFVAATPGAHFQQSWEWGELAPDLGGTVLRLAALDGERMVGAAQIFGNPLNGTGTCAFYLPRGPAVAEPSGRVVGALLGGAHQEAGELNAAGIRLEPSAPISDRRWPAVLRSLGLRPSYPPSQPRSSWVLDLSPDEDALLAAMKSKTRYNIRLAARKGVEVREGGEDDIDAFYDIFRQTAERDDFFIQPREFYRHMFTLFWRSRLFTLLLAQVDEKPIAAVTLLKFGPTTWYVHGASSNEHRNLMAPYLLQWEAIRRAKAAGSARYDFRAIPDRLEPDQDMYGVYRFKEGFGGYQYTTQHTWAAAYRPALFGIWQLFVRGRFELMQQRRRRQGLPARVFG